MEAVRTVTIVEGPPGAGRTGVATAAVMIVEGPPGAGRTGVATAAVMAAEAVVLPVTERVPVVATLVAMVVAMEVGTAGTPRARR